MKTSKQGQRLTIAMIFCLLFAAGSAYCITYTYYVAPDGTDSNPGTIGSPFKTITKGVSMAAAGDTVYVRAGTYAYTDTTGSITLPTKSGASDTNRCYLMGYNSERPFLDFSAMTGTSANGLTISGSYWYVKGLDCKNAPHNGIRITGTYNTIEFCTSFENRNSGVGIAGGASYNLIKNCDSYHNYDAPTSGGNADGFSPKIDVGTENSFYGCRSWGNSDDAYDGYLRPTTGPNSVNTHYENCWAFKCGWKWSDGSTTGSMNGNGFKMGGGDNTNAAKLRHNVTLKNCLSFNNKAKGFDENNNRGSMTINNCTAFNNGIGITGGEYNFSIPGPLASGQTATVTNCVSLRSLGVTLAAATQTTDSWQSPFVVTNADFVSIDCNGLDGARKADGSLPDISFMRLSVGSDLIDSGTDVGLPYNGAAPDLGAFEYLPGDCHSDGHVDLLDLKCLADNWLNSSCGVCNQADSNGDHTVNFLDYAIMAKNWLE